MRISLRDGLILALWLGAAGAASAEPPRPPHSYTVCSPTERFCADVDAVKDVVRVYEKRTGRIRWKMPGWFNNVWLSEDGDVVALTLDNVLPQYDAKLPVIGFFRRGRSAGKVRMGEVVPKNETITVVSGIDWGSCEGFGVDGRFSVMTPRGRRVYFSPTK